MLRRLLHVVGGVVGGVVAFAVTGLAFVLVAMRTQSQPMLNTVRRFNRAVTNRLQARSAGTAGAYASVIRHVGRSSGRSFATPVVPFATDDGFVISLPYGPNSDWLKNVLTSGRAVIVTDGQSYDVERPEVLSTAEVRDLFPRSEQLTHRLFGVERCLRLRHAGRA